MLVKSLLVWMALLTLAVLNGAFRETLLTPRFGAYTSHVVSTFMLCMLILLVTFVSLRWIGPPDLAAAWTIGLTWLALTLAFEFLAGHYLFGSPWSKLLADYDVLKGRVWALVLVTTAAAPALMAAWRHVFRP